jgi:hypothetical protein
VNAGVTAHDGIALCRSIIDTAPLARWTGFVDARYRALEAARAEGGPSAVDALLPPAVLTDVRVRARFAPNDFWRPALQPGDALVFRGDLVHRTHVTPAMTDDRTGIELRFFAADASPARLAGDRFFPISTR